MSKPVLKIENGELAGRTVAIDPDQGLLLGRSEGPRLELPDEDVALHHARVLVRGGRVLLDDLGSERGTRVNGESVARYPLKNGDVLELGQTRLVFHAEGDETPETEAAAGPHIDLGRPPPKPMPHFDRPAARKVGGRLVPSRERKRRSSPERSDE